MGQIDHLPGGGHLRQQRKCRARADVVEGFHDVIGDEGNRGAALRQLMIAGDAHGKIKLEAGAFRQIYGQLGTAGFRQGDQNLLRAIGLGASSVRRSWSRIIRQAKGVTPDRTGRITRCASARGVSPS